MYYVYQLLDPRDGSIFYVGKGKGDRWRAHEREARKGIASRKCDRIREILDSNLAVQCAFKSHHLCETEAFAAEARLISEIGIENLTNIVRSGARWGDASQRRKETVLRQLAPTLAVYVEKLARYGRLYITLGGCSVEVTDAAWSFVRRVFARFDEEDVLTALFDRWRKTNPALVREIHLWAHERRPDLLPAPANI